ncbi:MAG: hypothetical protein IKQ56_01150 [Lachnospiraceae bacterium]|nr:hypothetical protein [Lachnospiraceae bacterium]
MDGSIALPSSYNLRSLGMVTSVKDQGDKPYCLTDARIAALESALIKKGYENASVDLSETSMLYEDWVNSGSSSPFGVWCEYSGCETIGSANSFDNQFHSWAIWETSPSFICSGMLPPYDGSLFVFIRLKKVILAFPRRMSYTTGKIHHFTRRNE